MIKALEKAKYFKARIHDGGVRFGVQIGLSDPAVIEILGRAGYDWLLVDTEHAASSLLSVQAMLQAGAHTEALVLVRSLKLDCDEIRRLLDIGSPGVVCPFINCGDDARKLVSACLYPPRGIRGYGPRRSGIFGFDAAEYFRDANDAMVCIPIIESREAVDNIEQIVAIDGIEMVLVGPVDLSISLGVFMQYDHPTYLAAIDKVSKACRRYSKAMGTGCYSLEHARQCVAAGDQLLLIGGDDSFIATEGRRVLEAARSK